MALAIDASTPALATNLTTAIGGVVTTASFTAPSGALLVAVAFIDDPSGNDCTAIVTDSGGLAWTNQVESDAGTHATSGRAHCSIWTATTVSSVSRTVSMERDTGPVGNTDCHVKVWVVTGQAASPIGNEGFNQSTTNSITPTIFTSTATDSIAIVGGIDWTAGGTPTSSDLTLSSSTFHVASNSSGVSGWKALGATGSKTANLDAGGAAAAAWSWAALEIKAPATRLYFSTTGPAPATPSSWSAGWNKTTGTAADAPLLLGPPSSPATATATNAASGTSGHFTRIKRFISPPLLAQTISGTVKGQIRCNEGTATDNYTLAFALKVIKPDGTDRGVLIGTTASDSTATPPEMATALTNRPLQDSAENTSITLSSVAVTLGDHLVFEIGFRQASTSTAAGVLSVRAITTTTDLPEDSTTTAVNNPWIEFSDTIEFIGYYGEAATPAGEDAVAVGVADPTAVTPPTGMLAGDLVVMVGHERATGATLAVSASGGQSWSSLTAIGTTTVTARVFWCIFNGTWGANPSVDFAGTTCNSVQMHVFRPPATTSTWSVNVAQVELDIAAGTGVHTITGQTTTGTDPTVTLAGWFTADDNNWSTTSGTGWVTAGDEWYANTSGSDQSSTYAYKIQTAAGATGNVSRTQSLNGPDASTSFIITFAATVPSTAKTLTADTVAFSFTGATTTTVELGRELVPDAGSYAFAGQDATLTKAAPPKILSAEAGSYSFSGQAATFRRTYNVIAEATSYSFAGQTASLEHGWELVPEGGSYSFAGQAATFRRTYKLIPEAGSYAFAGQIASLEHGWQLVAAATNYSFSGTEASLLHEAAGETILGAGPGSYAFAGTAASLERGYVLVAETFVSAGGSPIGLLLTLTGGGGSTYSFSGSPVDLTITALAVLDAQSGSFSFAGQDVTLDRTFRVIAAAGAYSFAGQETTLDRTYRLIAGSTSYSFAGQQTTLDRTYKLIPEAGSFSFVGTDAELTYEPAGQTILGAAGGSFEYNGSDATLTLVHALELAVEAGAFSFSGSNATLVYTPTEPVAPGYWQDPGGAADAEFWIRKWREQAERLKPVVVKPSAEVINERPPVQHVIPAKDDGTDPELVEFTDFVRLLEKL